MAEYMVLIVGDADRWWTTMTPQQRKEGYEQYERFSRELTERGHRITGGAELHGSSETKRIAPGTSTVTDGPFAEATEQVGGYYQVETDDLDDLLDCCRIITAIGEGVEVRRVVQAQERVS